jgi:DNA polymerase delta subunit 1
VGEGPAQEMTKRRWQRPAPAKLDPAKDKLVFQQIELDHYIGKARADMPGASTGPAPVMRMFGVTMEGNSVCCHVHGFHPYVFIPAPAGIDQSNLSVFRKTLNTVLVNDIKNNSDGVVDAVLSCELVSKSTIYGFQGNIKIPFIKVTLAVPKMVAAARRLMEKGEVRIPGVSGSLDRPFEANIDFEIRFMADTQVVGCNWIELPAGVWNLRQSRDFQSRAQVEVDVAWDKLVSHVPEGEWSHVAPLRILSFDIECAGRKGIFPEAEKDPVIQIANMVVRQGEKEPFIRNVFTLDTCAQIVGSQVISCAREQDLLGQWASFVRECDPDIITGYNINNFDLPYLINRAKTLKVPNFNYLGRITNIQSQIKESVLQSKQMGRRENKTINIEGRVAFDLLLILVRDHKLRSYTLNAVSYHFLGE